MRPKTKERLFTIYSIFQKAVDNEISFGDLQIELAQNGYPLKERQLYKDLAALQKGIEDIAFTVNFKKQRKKYVLEQTSKINAFKDDQRNTLPILLSILEPYTYLPAVRIMHESLGKQFGKRYKKLIDIIKLHNKSTTKEHQENSIKWSRLAIQLVNHIENKKRVMFNYFQPYTEQGNFWLIKTIPLQIRIFEGRYYLLAIPENKEIQLSNIRSYPLDCIVAQKVELLDERISERYSLPKDFIMNLDELMRGCIGIMRPRGENPELKTMRFKFKGWAASLVESVPLHHSQKTVESGKDHIVISLQIYETDDIDFVIKRFRDFGERLT